MRFLVSLASASYGLALALATPAAAELDAARALAAETVPNLRFQAPAAPAATAFQTIDGAPADLSDYAGDVVVLNFWATWCAPCKAEMPSLQRLADATAGQGVAVVTMAFGRHNPAAMARFWDEVGATTLPLHRDPTTDLARALGVRGLPHTVVLDPRGMVVAQLTGEAEWDAPEMLAVLRELAE